MARSARAYTSNPKVRPSVEDLLASPFVLSEDILDAKSGPPLEEVVLTQRKESCHVLSRAVSLD